MDGQPAKTEHNQLLYTKDVEEEIGALMDVSFLSKSFLLRTGVSCRSKSCSQIFGWDLTPHC